MSFNYLIKKSFPKIFEGDVWEKRSQRRIFSKRSNKQTAAAAAKKTFFKILIFWPSKQFLKSDFTKWRVDSLAKISWLVCNIFVTLHDLAYYLSMLKLLRLDCKDLLLSSQSLKQVSTFKKLNLILCIIPNDTAY